MVQKRTKKNNQKLYKKLNKKETQRKRYADETQLVRDAKTLIKNYIDVRDAPTTTGEAKTQGYPIMVDLDHHNHRSSNTGVLTPPD